MCAATIRNGSPRILRRRSAARAAEEGAALAARAPVDLRVNILKCSREQALEKLAHLSPAPTPLSPIGLRIEAGQGRGPALTAETAYVKGLVEPQDEASQLAALLCAAGPGEQVLDLCAGGGGKALALAGQMHNRGQVYAYDADGRRLMPIHERLERAGARNIQVRAPRGKVDVLADLEARCDLVLIDAPCTGDRRLAAPSRRQMAARARRAGPKIKGAARTLGDGRPLREARRSARLRHLFGAARGKRGPDRGLSRRQS